MIVSLCRVSGRRAWIRGDLAEEPERPRLVALLPPLPGKVEHARRGYAGLVDAASREERLTHAQCGQYLEIPHLPHGSRCLLEEGQADSSSPLQDMERTQIQPHRGDEEADRQLLRHKARLAQERPGLGGIAPEGVSGSEPPARNGQAIRVADLLGELDRGVAVTDRLVEDAALGQGRREIP